MFRVTFLVEDKALPKVLHAVTGLVVNMEPPQPVTNAVLVKSGRGKAVEQVSTATSLKGRLIEYLASIKGSRITSPELRAKWSEFGGNPSGINGSLTTQLVEEKALKRISRGQFTALGSA